MQSYRRDYLNGAKPSGAARLKPKTREVYETGLKRIEAWAGKLPLTFITPARIGVLRDKCARPISDGGLGHSATFARLRVLRQLFAYAESVDLMPRGSNPATNFNLGKPPARRMVWELEDDAAFDAAAYELGPWRVSSAYTAPSVKVTLSPLPNLNCRNSIFWNLSCVTVCAMKTAA